MTFQAQTIREERDMNRMTAGSSGVAFIKTVQQTLALSPALSTADNMFMGRAMRKSGPAGWVLRQLDTTGMRRRARAKPGALGLMTTQSFDHPVATLTFGQQQERVAALGARVVTMDRAAAAPAVRKSRKIPDLIRMVTTRANPFTLISPAMPHVVEVATQIHIHRLGRLLCVVKPRASALFDAMARMTGALSPHARREPA